VKVKAIKKFVAKHYFLVSVGICLFYSTCI